MSTVSSDAPAVKPARKPRPKKERCARVLFPRLLSGDMLVEVLERTSATAEPAYTCYYVREIPADFGRAFRWEKFVCQGGEVYCVNVGDASTPASCECKGHEKWGHKTVCKHVACTRKLIAEGKL
jgi:hypothetical protein